MFRFAIRPLIDRLPHRASGGPVRRARCWAAAIAAFFALVALLNDRTASAGIGPENVIVVVNRQSADSKTIANHYIELRGIPTPNVILLDNVPTTLNISLAEFKEHILSPLLKEIDQRKLAAQTRVIAYSTGFPTGVRIPEHTAKLTDPAMKQYQTPMASINSLTYFYRFVLADSHEYLGWLSNAYARGRFDRNFINPFIGEEAKQLDAAEQAMGLAKFAESAQGFKQLAAKHPSVAPLSLRAAEAFIRDGKRGEAIEHLALAVRAGWSNRRYLTKDSPLKSLFSAKDLDDEAPEAERGPLGKLLAKLDDVPATLQGPIGFAGDVGWASNGYPVSVSSGGMSYLLSCVLAVTAPLGSTVSQAIDNLELSAASDHTFPDAVVGFAKTADVRSTTRFPAFPDAVVWLLARDRKAEMFPTNVPTTRTRYVGLSLGVAGFSIQDRTWSLVPGALAENLTSLGGAYDQPGQTKLTELLHAGAAMSCGAVAEPYSLPMKFPAPIMHAYYAEGVTAIEAYYLSITSPYQMLIVGDPLAQPFARSPAESIEISLNLLEPKDAPEDRIVTVTRRPLPVNENPDDPKNTLPHRHTPTAAIELFVQDRLVQRVRPIDTINLRLPNDFFGNINVRVVSVGDHPTQPRLSVGESFLFGPPELLPRITMAKRPSTDKAASETLRLNVQCTGAERIELLQFGQTIATVAGADGDVELKADDVGHGPIRFQAIGFKGERQLTGPLVTLPMP